MLRADLALLIDSNLLSSSLLVAGGSISYLRVVSEIFLYNSYLVESTFIFLIRSVIDLHLLIGSLTTMFVGGFDNFRKQFSHISKVDYLKASFLQSSTYLSYFNLGNSFLNMSGISLVVFATYSSMNISLSSLGLVINGVEYFLISIRFFSFLSIIKS